MLINSETVEHLIETAVAAACNDRDDLAAVLDEIPAPIYVTDKAGTITYFNRACVTFAGRTPTVGRDRWCVTWKLHTTDGEPLPHDLCPMAIAIAERRPIRDIAAVAERPDGTRVAFIPYPTPIFDSAGELAGAVNLLLEVSRGDKPDYLREQAARCRRLAVACTDRTMAETLTLMAAKYEQHALQLERSPPN